MHLNNLVFMYKKITIIIFDDLIIFSCQKWIELAQNKKINKLLETCGPLDLSKSYSICSIHFTKDDYMTNTSRPMLVEYKLPIYFNIKSLVKNLFFIINN